jgi:hypothetical protein
VDIAGRWFGHLAGDAAPWPGPSAGNGGTLPSGTAQ